MQSTAVGNRAMRMARARDMFGTTQAALKRVAASGPRGLLGWGKAGFSGLGAEFSESMLKLGVAKQLALADVVGTAKATPGAISSAFSSAAHNGGAIGVTNLIWGNVDVLDDVAKLNRAAAFTGAAPPGALLNGTQLFAGQIPNTALSAAGFADTYLTDFIPSPSGPPDVTGNATPVGKFTYREEEAKYQPPPPPQIRAAR